MVGIFHHVVDFMKDGIEISQHLLAIVHLLETDSETFEKIAS